MRGPLRDLRRCPEFCERVRQYLAVYRAKLAVEGLALKSNRIALLMRRAAIVRGVVRARGKHPPCQQYLAACRWPDGSIVRASNEYLFSIETGEKKLLVDSRPAAFYDYGAAFSADGAKLAFCRDGSVYVLELDGVTPKGQPTRLTGNPSELALSPSWSEAQVMAHSAPNAQIYGAVEDTLR